MSDDYIARLRTELLRAGTTPKPRRAARPLIAATAVALLLVAAVALVVPGERRDETPAQATTTLTYRVERGDAARIVRERLTTAGIAADVTRTADTLTITAPAAARADVAALTAPGRLAIYDWERSLVGGTSPLTESEARERAARTPGARALRSDGGWFVLRGDPALTNAQLASARAGEDPLGAGPAVALELTPAGQERFRALTRELARRGADLGATGDPLRTAQHLAFVLDDRILTTPYIDWREAPDGVDDAQISGFATPERARLTAALLSAGPLQLTAR